MASRLRDLRRYTGPNIQKALLRHQNASRQNSDDARHSCRYIQHRLRSQFSADLQHVSSCNRGYPLCKRNLSRPAAPRRAHTPKPLRLFASHRHRLLLSVDSFHTPTEHGQWCIGRCELAVGWPLVDRRESMTHTAGIVARPHRALRAQRLPSPFLRVARSLERQQSRRGQYTLPRECLAASCCTSRACQTCRMRRDVCSGAASSVGSRSQQKPADARFVTREGAKDSCWPSQSSPVGLARLLLFCAWRPH